MGGDKSYWPWGQGIIDGMKDPLAQSGNKFNSHLILTGIDGNVLMDISLYCNAFDFSNFADASYMT